MGLASGELVYPDKMFFVPCVPPPNGDFFTIYKRQSGDSSVDNLYCEGFHHDVRRRDHFPSLDYCNDGAGNVGNYVTARSKPLRGLVVQNFSAVVRSLATAVVKRI